MRAEAEDQGKLGMLMVGDVGVNRVRVDCLDFKNVRNVSQMVYQSPGGFESTQKGYFYQRARDRDIRLAKKVVRGEKYYPGSYALWFYRPSGDCPGEWFGQPVSGRFKAHCFYSPDWKACPDVYSTY